MITSETIKPESYLKSDISEILGDLSKNGKTMIITHDGVEKLVLQDYNEYKKIQDGIALIKILSIRNRGIQEGKFKPIEEAFNDLEERFKQKYL